MQEDHQIVRALEADANYEFVVVAVDGDYLTESAAQEVDTYGIGKSKIYIGRTTIFFQFTWVP